MSKQLKSKPLSNAKIASILANNPSAKNSSVVLRPMSAPVVTLSGRADFDTLQPDENLKSFLDFARNVITRYEGNQNRQKELEDETQDLLHYMELSKDMNACQGYDLYQKLRNVRRERRACKNEIDLLKPLYDYLCDKTVINQLSQIQGKCRASKQCISQRQYTLRTDVM